MRRQEHPLLVAGVLVATGLVVAVAAGGRSWAQPARGNGHPRAVAIGALVLVGLLLVRSIVRWIRSVGGLRPRGVSRAVVALLAALAFAAIVSMALVYLGPDRANTRGPTPGGFMRGGEGVRVPGGRADRSRGSHHSGFVLWLVAAGGVAAAGALGGTIYWLRRRREGEIDSADEPPAAVVAAALDQSLEELRRERDARRAVIACYARMELALSTVGMERMPTEAPLEYLERILLMFRASEEAVEHLTALFEEAKFSAHVVDERMREQAIAALSALRRDLRTRAPNPLAASSAAAAAA